MPHRWPAVGLGLAVLVALTILGCGGGGDESTGSPRTSTSPQGVTVTTSTTTDRNGNQITVVRGHGRARREPTGPGDVRKAVEAALTSTDPADACSRYVTQRYVRVAFGDRNGCEQAVAAGSAAKGVRIKSVSIAPNNVSAEAKAVPLSGPNSGALFMMELVFERGVWKLDRAHANVPVGP